MQSSVLGESNRRRKRKILRKLDNGEVLMHETLCPTVFIG